MKKSEAKQVSYKTIEELMEKKYEASYKVLGNRDIAKEIKELKIKKGQIL